MDTVLTPVSTARYAQMLARREAELVAVLHPPQPEMDSARDVLDFKDMAVEESQVTVNEAKSEQAAQELGLVLAAQRRLQDGSYGECVDCGEPIDPRRLMALPATPYCTACQSYHEARRATPPPAPQAARP